MLNNMTRSKVILIWFAVVAVTATAGVALGINMTRGTGALLAALCLVPPGIILALWPGVQAPTAADVLHGVDRRG